MGKKYCKTPMVFQMEATECGAASLAIICAYWGKYVPLEQMRIETGVSRDGCNAKNIMRAAKKFGMECHGYRRRPERLRGPDLPCMIHWKPNHFVVLEGFKGKYVYLNDPAVGRRRITFEELAEGFVGTVLTFRPTEAFKKEKRENVFFPLVLNRLKRQRAASLQMLCIGLLLVLPGVITPILSQLFLDEIMGSAGVSWFGQFLVFLGAAALFRAVITLYRSELLRKMQNKLVLTSSRKFLARMFRLPIAFFDQRYAGDLVGRVSDNDDVNTFLTGDLARTVLNLFVAIFYLALLLAYHPLMTAAGAVGIVINLVIAQLTSGSISNMTLKIRQDKGKLSGAVYAGLSVTSTLKASGAENAYSVRILGYEAKVSAQEQKVNRIQAVISAVPSAVSGVLDVILLMTGAVFVIRGQMTPGMLFAFSALFKSFSDPVEELVDFVKQIQTLKADVDRVDDIMRCPTDWRFEGERQSQLPQAKLSGRVDLDGISFGYSRLADPLVTELSLSLAPGSSAALVGASGCGKSTVSKLVSGLYRPWSGSVRFDGIPIEEISPEVLHASVSTVSQNISLFSGSIRDNLTLWNPAILEKDIISAAKDACIHDVITQKPGAYDFKLTEGGGNLSGGQRQCLEIARALVTNPTVLIMDEATSALDPLVEKQIIDNIKRRGCTCLIIAHRLSAVRSSDEILVMSDGRVAERGSHEELSAANGFYRRLMMSG